MLILAVVCVFQVLFLDYVSSEWVEIPQSLKKSYLVTPYSPYIYTPSSFFKSTTTEAYGTILPLSKPKIQHKPDTKKSITKMPDEVLMKTTTEIPFEKPVTKKYNQQHHNGNNPHRHSFVHSSKINNISSTANLNLKQTNRRVSQGPINIVSATLSPETSAKTTTKQFQPQEELPYEEEEVSDEVEEDYEEGDEYEPVYDDDEDLDDEEGADRNDGDHLDDDYYEDDEEYEDEPVNPNEAKGNGYPQPSNNNNAHINGFSYVNFLPYLQNIQSTLTREPEDNSISNKLSFLTDIKNRLLYAIQSRISSIWQPRSRRQTRATRGDVWDSWEKSHSDHGMEFPSNEGALLTLGFLTFAVFLIKCILKLIHAIKGKHDKGSYVKPIIIVNGTVAPTGMMMNGMNTIRFKRDIEDIDLSFAKIMNNIESYKPH